MTFAQYDLVRFQLQHIDGAQDELKKIEREIEERFPEMNALNPRKRFMDQYNDERVIDLELLPYISLDPIFIASLDQQMDLSFDRDAVIRHIQDPLHTAFYPGHLIRAYTVGIGFEIERARYIQFRMRQEIPDVYSLNDYTESELQSLKRRFTARDKPLDYHGKRLIIPANGALAFLQDPEPEIPELFIPRNPIVIVKTDDDFIESLKKDVVLDKKEYIPERKVFLEYGFFEPYQIYVGKLRNSLFLWRPAVPSNEFLQALEYFLKSSWMTDILNDNYLRSFDLRPVMNNFQAFIERRTKDDVKLLRAAQEIIVKSQKTRSFDLLRLYLAKRRTLLDKFKDLPSKLIRQRIRYDEQLTLNQLNGLALLLRIFGAMPMVRDMELSIFESMLRYDDEKLDQRILGSFIRSGSNIHIQWIVFLLEQHKEIVFPDSQITVKKDPSTGLIRFNGEIVQESLTHLEMLYELQPWDIYELVPAFIAEAERKYLEQRVRRK
jgi:hypothetical protein